MTFDKVERTLRDQEEELLSVERHGRSPHRPQATTGRRTFWVEQEGVWGILPEGVVDEFSDDQVLWATGEMQTSAGEETEDASCWTVTSSGNTLEWVYWDDEWCTQDHEGAWWSQADVQPWLDIEEIMALDNAAGQELMEIYGQFEAKRRSFQESRQIVKNKLLNRGFYPPKGKGIGKSPKGSFKREAFWKCVWGETRELPEKEREQRDPNDLVPRPSPDALSAVTRDMTTGPVPSDLPRRVLRDRVPGQWHSRTVNTRRRAPTWSWTSQCTLVTTPTARPTFQQLIRCLRMKR